MISIDDRDLLCPDCDGSYLHQEEVRVIFRDDEDGPASQSKITGNGTEVSRLHDSEVPGRRDVIQIDFSCELCAKDTRLVKTLQIMQHKGQTLVEWL